MFSANFKEELGSKKKTIYRVNSKDELGSKKSKEELGSKDLKEELGRSRSSAHFQGSVGP